MTKQTKTSETAFTVGSFPVADSIHGAKGRVSDLPATFVNHFVVSNDLTGALFINGYCVELNVLDPGKAPLNGETSFNFSLPFVDMEPTVRLVLPLDAALRFRDVLNTVLDTMTKKK